MSGVPDPSRVLESALADFADHRPARAYGGPAHGQSWTVRDELPPEAVVELRLDSGSALYRLVRHPRTHLPARDHVGNLLYMFFGEPLDLPAAVHGVLSTPRSAGS